MSEIDIKDLDQIDFRIMRKLVEDGRASDVKLGEELQLSSTAVARRRKILEEAGYIKGYSADLDMRSLGYGIMVIVLIELSSQAENVLRSFEQAVLDSPSMQLCAFVSGDMDFMMILNVRSFEDYDTIYRKELSALPHVAKIRSSFVMRQVATRPIAPIVLSEK